MAMNKERILALADHLDKVRKSKFSLSSWYTIPDEDDTKALRKIEKNLIPAPAKESDYRVKNFFLKEGFCNTTACVLGHAATMKEFNEAGLGVNFNVWADEEDEVSLSDLADASVDVVYIKGKRTYYSNEAGAAFFGIPKKHADILFAAGSGTQTRFYFGGEEGYAGDITPKQVAKALREYVATNGKSLAKLIKQEEG